MSCWDKIKNGNITTLGTLSLRGKMNTVTCFELVLKANTNLHDVRCIECQYTLESLWGAKYHSQLAANSSNGY